MENIWLGCWKGLFLGMPQNNERIAQIKSSVEAISKIAPCKNERLLQVIIILNLFINNLLSSKCFLKVCETV